MGVKLKENRWRGKNHQDIYLYSCKEEADLMFMLEDFLFFKNADNDNCIIKKKTIQLHIAYVS